MAPGSGQSYNPASGPRQRRRTLAVDVDLSREPLDLASARRCNGESMPLKTPARHLFIDAATGRATLRQRFRRCVLAPCLALPALALSFPDPHQWEVVHSFPSGDTVFFDSANIESDGQLWKAWTLWQYASPQPAAAVASGTQRAALARQGVTSFTAVRVLSLYSCAERGAARLASTFYRDVAATSEIVTAPSGDTFFAEFMSGPVPDGSAPAAVLHAICASPHVRRSPRPLWGN